MARFFTKAAMALSMSLQAGDCSRPNSRTLGGWDRGVGRVEGGPRVRLKAVACRGAGPWPGSSQTQQWPCRRRCKQGTACSQTQGPGGVGVGDGGGGRWGFWEVELNNVGVWGSGGGGVDGQVSRCAVGGLRVWRSPVSTAHTGRTRCYLASSHPSGWQPIRQCEARSTPRILAGWLQGLTSSSPASARAENTRLPARLHHCSVSRRKEWGAARGTYKGALEARKAYGVLSFACVWLAVYFCVETIHAVVLLPLTRVRFGDSHSPPLQRWVAASQSSYRHCMTISNSCHWPQRPPAKVSRPPTHAHTPDVKGHIAEGHMGGISLL